MSRTVKNPDGLLWAAMNEGSTLFEVLGDKTSMHLSATRIRLALVPVVRFIIMMWAWRSKTEEILAANPDDPAVALFVYYMSIFAVIWIISAAVNSGIRTHYSTDKSPKNT